MEDLMGPLTGEDVLMGRGKPAIALGLFPAFVGNRYDAADGVGCGSLLKECSGHWSRVSEWVNGEGVGYGTGVCIPCAVPGTNL
eukprot:scaffold90336_cov63-Attheya_sp.AAC.4